MFLISGSMFVLLSGSMCVFYYQGLCPVEVVVGPGDAVVWFPGWEHETRITQGLSVSLSLHFDTAMSSLYVKTFINYLADKVSPLFRNS